MTQWTLDGKVALITGGARGIGAAGAAELARRGATVVLADVDLAALAATEAAIPGATSVALDVTDYAACEQAVATTLGRHGRLDIVWANAGIGAGGPAELVDVDVWTRVLQVNLLGAYYTVRAALPAVIDARGYVAITASVAAFSHPPGLSAYAASKAGIEAFANSLRIEVAHQGVDVGTLHPTWIATDMVTGADAESATFRRLRKAMTPPFSRTYPVDAIVGPLVDGFAQRKGRICLPGFVRIAHVLRAALRTKAFEREVRKAVPEMRELFVAQAAEEGAHRASLGSRWS
jgi:NAD(P)-dependent dehydrogenase (short-subunit alcohol dehydrogenase family)